jgi:colicin import membrane protein
MRGCRVLAVSVWMSCAAWAESTPPPEVPQTLEQASAQRERAKAMRAEAERQQKEAQDRCYSKFLVNDCLAAAKKRYTEAIVEARRLDQPARDFEREAKRQERAAKEAQHAADLPLREGQQKERAEIYRADEAAKAAAREQKLADKARKAEEGRRKAVAEQASRQAKLDKRAKQDAERAAKKSCRRTAQGGGRTSHLTRYPVAPAGHRCQAFAENQRQGFLSDSSLRAET